MATRKCKKTGRLKKPTKSGRRCIKKKKCKNGNLKTHIKKRQCKKSKRRRRKRIKPTKSKRRKIKKPLSNCAGLKKDTCIADPNCIYKRGKKQKHHCAAKPGSYEAYNGPIIVSKTITTTESIPQPVPQPVPQPTPQPTPQISKMIKSNDTNNNLPVGSNEWACVNPYDINSITNDKFKNSCIQGGTPKPGYDKLPRDKENCRRLCIK